VEAEVKVVGMNAEHLDPVIVAEREYPASPGPLCGYCDFLEICREGKGFAKSHPAGPEGEPPFE
jgi:hypothetical protein